LLHKKVDLSSLNLISETDNLITCLI